MRLGMGMIFKTLSGAKHGEFRIFRNMQLLANGLVWIDLTDLLMKSQKRPSVAFLRLGKRKERFSLSLQINDLRRKPLICTPVHGRDDAFLRSHHLFDPHGCSTASEKAAFPAWIDALAAASVLAL